MAGLRVLLLSAYDATSHQQWRKGLEANLPAYDWTVLTLPARHFNWRIRGNSLSWALTQRERLSRPYDRLIATSMVDVATLRGLVPALGTVPTLLYFHENQFAYPLSHQAEERLEPKMVQLYGALAADIAVFNSEYNRQTFMQGVAALLKKMPDAVPPGVMAQLAGKSSVLPVPLETRHVVKPSSQQRGHLQIIWNHRWEYDKAPEVFFAALQQLSARGVEFTVHVVGQRFRRVPPLFREMREKLAAHAGEWGWIEKRENYLRLLRQAQVVVSTARHDFQGLGVLEAVAAGCLPLVPDRLAYPEWFPARWRYPSTPEDSGQEALSLAVRLQELAEMQKNGGLPRAPDVSYLGWERLGSRYRALIEESVIQSRENDSWTELPS